MLLAYKDKTVLIRLASLDSLPHSLYPLFVPALKQRTSINCEEEGAQ